REREAVRDCRAEIKPGDWCGIGSLQRRGIEDPNLLLAADLAERRDEAGAVRRQIEIVHHRSIWPRHHLRPLSIRRRDPNERADAVQMPDSPERAIGAIEHEVADAGVLHQDLLTLRRKIESNEVP